MRRAWTNHDVAKLRAWRSERRTAPEIAKEFGITERAVHAALRRYRVDRIQPRSSQELRSFAEWAALDRARAIKTKLVPIIGRTSLTETPGATP